MVNFKGYLNVFINQLPHSISIANNCFNKYFEISLCGLVVYTEINREITPIVILGWFIKEFMLKLLVQDFHPRFIYIPNEVR